MNFPPTPKISKACGNSTVWNVLSLNKIGKSRATTGSIN
jgi:hypothetical protein